MNLARILRDVPVIETQGDQCAEISQITCDSRRCSPGSLFVALRGGVHDGHDYIDEAVRAGARAVLHEKPIERPGRVSSIRVADTRRALGRAAKNFYDDPSRKLLVVGVTGTNGKTTVTYLLESILQAAGLKTGVIGTVNCRYGQERFPLANTTPESLDLQRILKDMADAGLSHVVMEVSSHAIDMQRVCDVDFDRGVFTNLSSEHLDYHGSLDRYFDVKRRFFTDLLKKGPAVVNIDDPWGRRLAAVIRTPLVTFGLGEGCDVRAEAYSATMEGFHAMVSTPGKTVEVRSSLAGTFNLLNVLAAVALATTLDIPDACIVEGVAAAPPVPGRLERIPSEDQIAVFVDYAHTEDALRNVLETLRQFRPNRLITVFGCGGERDRSKRPRMGRVATELSDCTIVTSDNPRGEDPEAIIGDIESGIDRSRVRKDSSSGGDVLDSGTYRIIEDRADAITRAVCSAMPGDIVLIAGKGHEDYQIVGSRRLPFDDRLAAAGALAARRPRCLS